MTQSDEERGLGGRQVELSDEAVHLLVTRCDGDARKLLTSSNSPS